MTWAMDDLIKNRPPLSRWHPDYQDAFAAFLARRAAADDRHLLPRERSEAGEGDHEGVEGRLLSTYGP